jgi:hypothetical protein
MQNGLWDMINEAQNETDLEACAQLLKHSPVKHRMLNLGNNVLSHAVSLDELARVDDLAAVGESWFEQNRGELESFLSPLKRKINSRAFSGSMMSVQKQ